jgi:hypothetical protein
VDAGEVHPLELVTVKLYDPGTNPVMVNVVADPVRFPGLIVQVPDGSPLSTTLPVETVQVGWVIVPTTGAAGMALTVRVAAFEVALLPPVQLLMEHLYW